MEVGDAAMLMAGLMVGLAGYEAEEEEEEEGEIVPFILTLLAGVHVVGDDTALTPLLRVAPPPPPFSLLPLLPLPSASRLPGIWR